MICAVTSISNRPSTTRIVCVAGPMRQEPRGTVRFPHVRWFCSTLKGRFLSRYLSGRYRQLMTVGVPVGGSEYTIDSAHNQMPLFFITRPDSRAARYVPGPT